MGNAREIQIHETPAISSPARAAQGSVEASGLEAE